jgi:hypothetical protein
MFPESLRLQEALRGLRCLRQSSCPNVLRILWSSLVPGSARVFLQRAPEQQPKSIEDQSLSRSSRIGYCISRRPGDATVGSRGGPSDVDRGEMEGDFPLHRPRSEPVEVKSVGKCQLIPFLSYNRNETTRGLVLTPRVRPPFPGTVETIRPGMPYSGIPIIQKSSLGPFRERERSHDASRFHRPPG